MGSKIRVLFIIGALISSSIYGVANASQGSNRNPSNNNVACTQTQSSKSAPNSNSRATTCNTAPQIISISLSNNNPIVGIQIVATPVVIGTPAPTISYQWRRNGINISLATGSSYTVTSQDIGSSISVRVTATNIAGTASLNSASTSEVPNPGEVPQITEASIQCNAAPCYVGTNYPSSLYISATVTGTPTPALTYQWFSDGVVSNVTSNNYVLSDSDTGKQITGIITATNDLGSISSTVNYVVPLQIQFAGFGDSFNMFSNLPSGVSFDVCESGNATNCITLNSSISQYSVKTLSLSGLNRYLTATFYNSSTDFSTYKFFIYLSARAQTSPFATETTFIPDVLTAPRVDFTSSGQTYSSVRTFSNGNYISLFVNSYP